MRRLSGHFQDNLAERVTAVNKAVRLLNLLPIQPLGERRDQHLLVEQLRQAIQDLTLALHFDFEARTDEHQLKGERAPLGKHETRINAFRSISADDAADRSQGIQHGG